MSTKKLTSFHDKSYDIFKRLLGDESEGKDQKTTKSLFWLFKIAVSAILFIGFINLVPIFFSTKSQDISTSTFGGWGDFFGGVLNPILTFLTFMGLLITIVLQQKELRLTREVLKDQKDEFIEQTEALKNQQKEMDEQTFDNKFFQMLNSFNNLVTNLEYEHVLIRFPIGAKNDNKINNIYRGKKVIKHFVERLFSKITPDRELVEQDDIQYLAYIISKYEKFNDENEEFIRYYFLNLYQLLRYVDQEIPPSINPKQYTNIIRAQLTKYELILLFYNTIGIFSQRNKGFLELVENYELLEHLQFDQGGNNYIDRATMTLSASYDIKAFGDNSKYKNELTLKFKGKIPNLRKQLLDGLPNKYLTMADWGKKLPDDELK